MHDHPIFTGVYRALAGLGERAGLGDLRARVLEPARGRLLIVGLGPGHDLVHLPPAVTSVVALEPSESMRAAARSRVAATKVRGIDVEVLDARGEAIPLADNSIDSVLLAYVMCSVDDVDATLAEVYRVVRPGGAVCTLEHVRAQPDSWHARAQRFVRPWWPRLAGGCQVDRDTLAALAKAGFEVSGIATTTIANLPPVAPTIVGVAWAPEVTNAANQGVSDTPWGI